MTHSLNYHLLRAALKHYGAPPSQLEPGVLRKVEHQARREYDVEQRALSAPEAAGVHVNEESIDHALTQLRSRYESDQDWLAALEANHLDETTMRAALARELRVEAVLERVAARAAKATELDIQLFYQIHRERFRQPEQRTARHILITVNPDFPENAPERAAARMEEIAQRVREKPRRFAEQALKHSECPTAMHGGLLGKVTPGTLYPELDAVLFRLALGEVSAVISSEIGLHLLYCEAIHEQRLVPLHEAAPRIRERLEDRYRLQYQRDWLAALSAPNG